MSVGGTREHLDPVRFLGNSSSGRMGWAVARAARLRGASVHAVVAHTEVAGPSGIEVEQVGSTAELGAAMTRAAKDADVVVMAAAPADFTPADVSETKIKKAGDAGTTRDPRADRPTCCAAWSRPARTPARSSSASRPRPRSTRPQLVALGRGKLLRKGCDLLVLNAVGRDLVFGREDNEITLLARRTADGG